MRTYTLTAIALAGLSGSVLAADNNTVFAATEARVVHTGHLYINIATGERILTQLSTSDLQAGASSFDGEEVWVLDGVPDCDQGGGSTSTFFLLDSSENPIINDSSPGILDWGDIEKDTVVDCVQIHWITNHTDSDSNSDSFADGVEGFGATWTFWDGINGSSAEYNCIAAPLITFTFANLPGELSDPGDSSVAFYTADVDLGNTDSFGTSLTFEIGDTDSDLQGASTHNVRFDLQDLDSNSIPDIDPDEDGLADWGWSIDYHQPGTFDFDNADGDFNQSTGVDGDLSGFAIAGVTLALAGPGEAILNPKTESFEWFPGPGAPKTTEEFGLLEFGEYAGPFVGVPGQLCGTDFAGFDVAIGLYATAILCNADLNGDGVLDFFDVSLLLTTGIDYNEDTSFDFFDISSFLFDFGNGCP